MSDDWTVETLRIYLERILDEREKSMSTLLSSHFVSAQKSQEFHSAIDVQARTLMSKSEAESQFRHIGDLIRALQEDMVILTKNQSEIQGGSRAERSYKTQSQWLIALLVSMMISVIGGVATLVFYLSSTR